MGAIHISYLEDEIFFWDLKNYENVFMYKELENAE